MENVLYLYKTVGFDFVNPKVAVVAVNGQKVLELGQGERPHQVGDVDHLGRLAGRRGRLTMIHFLHGVSAFSLWNW